MAFFPQEVHGRKWRLIADMIPTKTTLQVKNYAHQYLKNQVSCILNSRRWHFLICIIYSLKKEAHNLKR